MAQETDFFKAERNHGGTTRKHRKSKWHVLPFQVALGPRLLFCKDPPLTFFTSFGSAFQGTEELPVFGTRSHPAQLEFPREAQVSASRGRVLFSAFCSSRAREPSVLQRGMRRTVLCPEHPLPSASLRAPGCFCYTCGWMRESLIIRDYCSVTSFQTEADALWIQKWVTYGGVLEML